MDASGPPPYGSSSSPATESNISTSNGAVAKQNPSSGALAPGYIIAFEVIFSIVLFLIIASCYTVGMRRRRRRRKARLRTLQAACTESMLERAYARNERPIHSIIQDDPPPYFPHDSTLRVPDHAVTRLSNALLRAHTMQRQPLSELSLHTAAVPNDFPPKYSDLHVAATLTDEERDRIRERRYSLQSLFPPLSNNDSNNDNANNGNHRGNDEEEVNHSCTRLSNSNQTTT